MRTEMQCGRWKAEAGDSPPESPLLLTSVMLPESRDMPTPAFTSTGPAAEVAVPEAQEVQTAQPSSQSLQNGPCGRRHLQWQKSTVISPFHLRPHEKWLEPGPRHV